LTEKQEEEITKKVVASEKDAVLVEAKKTAAKVDAEEEKMEKKKEADFKEEDAKIAKAKAGEKTPEEQKAALDVKIEELNVVAHTEKKTRQRKELAEKIKGQFDDDKRKKSIVEGFKNQLKDQIKATEAEAAAKVASTRLLPPLWHRRDTMMKNGLPTCQCTSLRVSSIFLTTQMP